MYETRAPQRWRICRSTWTGTDSSRRRLAEHRPRLLRAAYAMCGSRDDAEDLVQETFERVLRRPRFVQRDRDVGVPAPGAPPHVRGARRHGGAAPDRARRRRRSSSGSPTRRAGPELAMDAQLAYAAMAELSEPLRATIVAVDVVGLSYKEAARSLRTRTGTIMSRLYRARRAGGRRTGGAMTEHRSTRLSQRDQALLVQLADGALGERARRRAEARAARDPGRRAADRAPAPGRARARRRRGAARAGARDAARRLRTVAARRQRDRRRARPARGAGAGRRAVDGRARRRPRAAARDPAGARGVRRRPARRGRRRAVPRLGTRVRLARDGHAPATRLDGRRTTTVFYEHTGHRLAYTIVSGPPLPRPDAARVVRRDGLEIALYRDPGHGGHDVAVFERGGRTCVVAGHVRELDTLLKLAAWKGGGSIRS